MEPVKINLKAYQKLFIFENNLRAFIQTELKSKDSQWFSLLPTQIQTDSQDQKDKMISYLSTDIMSPNPLNYLFLSHLRKIIINKWNVFFTFFQNVDSDSFRCQKKIENKFFELEVIRNFLAHNHLMDDKLLTQLDANINFFKIYIPGYNDQIYSCSNIDNKAKEKFLNGIVKYIRKKENIPLSLIDESFKYFDNEILEQLKVYNNIPKTRDKREALDQFLIKSHLLKKLEIESL